MLKAGPSPSSGGRAWDHKGKSEIAEIIISRSATCINFIHFVYVEDGGNKLVLSEKIGVDFGGSISLNTIMLDYPHELITGVTGKYQTDRSYGGTSGRLISLTVVTNKSKYGPFEVSRKDQAYKDSITEFDYYVGCKQFGGFFGTVSSEGIGTIGIYLKPLEKLPMNPVKKE